MYKYEFFDPEMSFEDEIIDTLQKKQKEKAEEAEPQKKLPMKEGKKRRKFRIRLKKRR